MEKTVVLSVGQDFHLKLGKDHIVYAGMPADKVYCIVQRKSSFMYQGFAWNLFYPERRTDIIIDGVAISVEHVTPDEIGIRVG